MNRLNVNYNYKKQGLHRTFVIYIGKITGMNLSLVASDGKIHHVILVFVGYER
ncbi:MAG: hypothetical protein WCJ61_17060 [Paludibacter sp.]